MDITSPIAVAHARETPEPAYPADTRVYPRRVGGPFRRAKWATLVALLALYYLLPWVRWDRGSGLPDQAVLVDMVGRRLYLFGLEIWPQEIYYLTGLLILAAFALFLATSLFGRVWCGYACPQTVWTDLFMLVERWIEGDRTARMRLDARPLDTAKVLRKTAKHTAWLLVAAATGGAWVTYFNDAPTLVRSLFTGEAAIPVYLFVGLFTATTYLLAGHAREKVCTQMCPWPRIQGGLLDRDSLVVTYRDWRGEPRAPHKKGTGWEGRGDCIDCHQCVAVCPTGVDIRDGLQLGCIGCGLCIDACNDAMTKVGRPDYLIAWDSERNHALCAAGAPPAYRLLRSRTALYGALLALVAVIMLGALTLRSSTGVSVLHDREPLFVTLSNGSIRNGYTVKILNKGHEDRLYRVALADSLPATYRLLGQRGDLPGPIELRAAPGGVSTHQLHVTLPRSALGGGETLNVAMVVDDVATGESVRSPTFFRGPRR